MPFKLPKNGEYEIDWPVNVKVPADGGKHESKRFTARFKVLPNSQTKELDEQAIDSELLDKIVVGWGEDLMDENNAPLPFNDDTKKAVLDIQFVRMAVLQAYFNAVTNAKRKN